MAYEVQTPVKVAATTMSAQTYRGDSI